MRAPPCCSIAGGAVVLRVREGTTTRTLGIEQQRRKYEPNDKSQALSLKYFVLGIIQSSQYIIFLRQSSSSYGFIYDQTSNTVQSSSELLIVLITLDPEEDIAHKSSELLKMHLIWR